MELITAKEAVKQLKRNIGVVISEQRFGRLKQTGAFKVHRKPNSRRDWFILDEVVEGYFNYVSPRTDEQHKVRTEYYKENKSVDSIIKELTANDLKIEQFDVPKYLEDDFKNELVGVNTANWVLRDFANDLLRIIEPIHHPFIKDTLDKSYFNYEIMQDTLDTMIDEYE